MTMNYLSVLCTFVACVYNVFSFNLSTASLSATTRTVPGAFDNRSLTPVSPDANQSYVSQSPTSSRGTPRGDERHVRFAADIISPLVRPPKRISVPLTAYAGSSGDFRAGPNDTEPQTAIKIEDDEFKAQTNTSSRIPYASKGKGRADAVTLPSNSHPTWEDELSLLSATPPPVHQTVLQSQPIHTVVRNPSPQRRPQRVSRPKTSSEILPKTEPEEPDIWEITVLPDEDDKERVKAEIGSEQDRIRVLEAQVQSLKRQVDSTVVFARTLPC